MPNLECTQQPDIEFFKEEGGRQNFLSMGVRVPAGYVLPHVVTLKANLHYHPSLQP